MKKIIIFIASIMLLISMQPKAVAATDSNLRIYSLIVDRFMNANEDNNKHIHNEKDVNLPFGGDFNGIISKMDYIKKMGFNTLHVSPVFEKNQKDYLGYDIKNYVSVDEVYGGEKQFKKMIKLAHDKKMKVIVDIPTTVTDGFTATPDTKMNTFQKKYFKDKKIIDLNNPDNQKKYKEAVTQFVEKFGIDGVSMYAMQDGIDAKAVFPDHIETIAILNEDINVSGFSHVQKLETTKALANAFKTTDQDIPDKYESNELLSSDNFFMPRFTNYAAKENMFPGTRIKQMMSYLMIQKMPISMTYGTEIAMNGDKAPDIHQLLDFRVEKEVIEYLEVISGVYKKYDEMFEGKSDVIYNNKGNQLIYFDTKKVDFVYNVNNTSKATNVKLDSKKIPKDQMLSGLLIGDRVHYKDNKFSLITNREEAELYAVVKNQGFNNGYLIAAGTIVVLFTAFIIGATRNRKKYLASQHNNTK
ncbi:alpha-amylase family glycosyl hydrolase [Macrococcus sp. EM39E]|uniref:alpha-amylase family glycosyl hydrolase n=1 Tax=Macrococcus animalis TaxID=3395467 RepID=UPI0039BFCE76